MCSEDVNYYLERPFYDNDTHGLFAVLFAAIKMSKLSKSHAGHGILPEGGVPDTTYPTKPNQ
jgi:hypothetical protein